MEPETDPEFGWLERVTYQFKRISGLGVYPDFMIIGGQKCGTTTFFSALVQHPDIFPPRKKEPNYFSYRFHRRAAWYRAQFPACTTKLWRRMQGRGFHTCEASTYYLFHPKTPARVHERLPDLKLIALLREPVSRAFSHYKHMCRIGAEDLPFEEALDAEDMRLEKEKGNDKTTDPYDTATYRNHTYLTRGIYIDQLLAWTKYFKREQLLVLQAEEYRRNPEAVMNRAQDFLGLPKWQGFQHKSENVGGYSDRISEKTRERLRAHFQPHNERLWQWLGETWDWTV